MARKPKGAVQQLSDNEMRRKIKQSANFKTVYANHTRVASSFYDIRIFLGQSNISPTGEITVEEDICVIMSPECAKGFSENVVKTLSQYEHIFGRTRSIVPQVTKDTGTEKPLKN